MKCSICWIYLLNQMPGLESNRSCKSVTETFSIKYVCRYWTVCVMIQVSVCKALLNKPQLDFTTQLFILHYIILNLSSLIDQETMVEYANRALGIKVCLGLVYDFLYMHTLEKWIFQGDFSSHHLVQHWTCHTSNIHINLISCMIYHNIDSIYLRTQVYTIYDHKQFSTKNLPPFTSIGIGTFIPSPKTVI